MKRISLFFLAATLCARVAAYSQDAATEERLNKLSGQIEDLIAGQKEQKARFASLAKEVEALREQMSKPTGNYAAQEDLKRLADNIKEVDRKRIEDNEKVRSELMKLAKIASSSSSSPPKKSGTSTADVPTSQKSAGPETGYEYTIQKNDTLSLIVQAYREKNIKVTTDQILKANPTLKPNQLRVGQKIFIPAPGKTEG